MSQGPSIIAELGLNRGQFKTEAKRTEDDLKSVGEKAKEAAGNIALLERQLSSGAGTSAHKQALSALKSEYRDTMQQMKLLETQKRSLDAAMGKGGSHGNRQELGHSARAITDMMLAGQSPLQAGAMEAPRIIQGMGGGIGSIIGFGIAIGTLNKVGEKISETAAKARELKSALMEALRPEASQGEQGESGLRARLKELDAVIEESAPKLKIWDRMWRSMGDNFDKSTTQLAKVINRRMGVGTALKESFWNGNKTPEGSISDQDAKLREAAEQRREETLGKIVAWGKQENDLRDRALISGKESIRQAELELEKKQKLAKIEEDLGIPHTKEAMEKVSRDPTLSVTVQAGRLAQLQKELDTKQDAATKLQAEAEREFSNREREAARALRAGKLAVETEERILAIKKEGIDVENRVAQLRLDAAKALLANGPKSGLEHDNHQEAVSSAELALRDTREQTAEKHAENAEAKRLAGINAPEPIKRRQQLESDKGLLQGRLDKNSDTYEYDDLKREGYEKDLAEKEAALRALTRDDKDREFARRREQIDAEVRNGLRGAKRARPGAQASLDAIDDKLAINADESAYNAPGDGNRGFTDPQIASRLTAEATELRRQKEGIQEAEAKTLREAQETTKEMDLQSKGETRAAAEARTRAGYEEKIAAALKAGNSELAAQYQKQQAIAALEAAVDKALETPEQRAAEAKKEHDRAFVRGQILNLQHRHEQNQAANSSMDPLGAKRGMYGEASEVPRDGTRAVEASGNSRSLTFDQRFKGAPVPTLPDRRPDIDASHANAGKSDGAFTDVNIVKAVQAVESAVKGISLKNRA